MGQFFHGGKLNATPGHLSNWLIHGMQGNPWHLP